MYSQNYDPSRSYKPPTSSSSTTTATTTTQSPFPSSSLPASRNNNYRGYPLDEEDMDDSSSFTFYNRSTDLLTETYGRMQHNIQTRNNQDNNEQNNIQHQELSSLSSAPLLQKTPPRDKSFSSLPPLPNQNSFQYYPYGQNQRNNSDQTALKKQESANAYEMSVLDHDQSRELYMGQYPQQYPQKYPQQYGDRHRDGNRNRDLPDLPHNHDPFIDNDRYDSVPLPELPPLPSANPFYSNNSNSNNSNNNPRESLTDVEKRMRRNEKNRLYTLRSKPRFHYTKLPYFTILVTLIQVIVFIVELAKMSILTGSAFQTSPYFNPMLGPSTYLLIYMGARYVPCMHQITGITDDTTISFPCANSTTVDTFVCSLNDLCGLSGIPTFDDGTKFAPNQWYRIFIPIFLHAGFLHIFFNLLLQLTMGASIERNIGILKYALIYIMSGIAGFLLGANFTPQGIASTGASGALFGVVATNIILFIYTGRKNTNMYGTKHYKLFIFFMFCEIVISFVLGLLPGLDNFSHLGGFAMGILSAILLLKDPFWIYNDGIITYRRDPTTWQQFVNNWNPLFAYEDKIPLRFLIWVGVRVVALVLIIIYFVLLAKNFFNNDYDLSENCKWCKYFNCIPVKGWCDIGQVTVSTTTPTATGATGETGASGSGSIASETTVPTQIYSTAIYTTTVPTTETGSNNGAKIKRQAQAQVQAQAQALDAFKALDAAPSYSIGGKRTAPFAATTIKSTTNTTPTTLTELNFVQQSAIGVGLYLILTVFMICFLKRKKVL